MSVVYMLVSRVLKRFFKVFLSTKTGSEKDINISDNPVDTSMLKVLLLLHLMIFVM